MFSLKRKITKFLSCEEHGVTSLEYALLGSLVAVVIAASVTNLGVVVHGLYTNVANLVAAAV